MKIEITIDEDVNEVIDSLEKLVKLTEDVKYLVEMPPFKIKRGKFGKKVKVNYKKRYREIRIKRDFGMIKVTREIEKERGLKEGLYDYTSVKINSLQYMVSDSVEVKSLEGKQETKRGFIDVEFYNEKGLGKLRNPP